MKYSFQSVTRLPNQENGEWSLIFIHHLPMLLMKSAVIPALAALLLVIAQVQAQETQAPNADLQPQLLETISMMEGFLQQANAAKQQAEAAMPKDGKFTTPEMDKKAEDLNSRISTYSYESEKIQGEILKTVGDLNALIFLVNGKPTVTDNDRAVLKSAMKRLDDLEAKFLLLESEVARMQEESRQASLDVELQQQTVQSNLGIVELMNEFMDWGKIRVDKWKTGCPPRS